jgi:hypothetical protein
MDAMMRAHFDNLSSDDGQTRYDALEALMAATNAPVDWAYEVWDDLVQRTRHPDNHQRAIATTLLCNLAKSDADGRILKALPAIMAVTRDDKFVTARHTIQALWKIGAAGEAQRQAVLARTMERFVDCAAEKNCTLIRYDLLVGLRELYTAVPDEAIKTQALALIESETDSKYRKKYQTVWKK